MLWGFTCGRGFTCFPQLGLHLLRAATNTSSAQRELREKIVLANFDPIVLGHDNSEQAKNREDRRGALNRTRHAKHTETASETQH